MWSATAAASVSGSGDTRSSRYESGRNRKFGIVDGDAQYGGNPFQTGSSCRLVDRDGQPPGQPRRLQRQTGRSPARKRGRPADGASRGPARQVWAASPISTNPACVVESLLRQPVQEVRELGQQLARLRAQGHVLLVRFGHCVPPRKGARLRTWLTRRSSRGCTISCPRMDWRQLRGMSPKPR
jgi:hypothetical protein